MLEQLLLLPELVLVEVVEQELLEQQPLVQHQAMEEQDHPQLLYLALRLKLFI